MAFSVLCLGYIRNAGNCCAIGDRSQLPKVSLPEGITVFIKEDKTKITKEESV